MDNKTFIERFLKEFAPKISNKELKQYNVYPNGYLWNICLENLIPHYKGKEARIKFDSVNKTSAIIINMDTDNETYLLPDAWKDSKKIENWSETFIVASNFSWVYIMTHESSASIGPFFIINQKDINEIYK